MDWTKGYRRSFSFYEVDADTWKDKAPMSMVRSCKVTRNADSNLIESASFELDDGIGYETYIRVYMDCEGFDGTSARECLGTFLIPSSDADMDGKAITYSCKGYSPLKELDDNQPPVGYTAAKGSDPVAVACQAINGNSRIQVVPAVSGTVLSEPYTADDSDTWLDYIRALAEKGGYELRLDAYGRAWFEPDKDVTALRPSWTYGDDDSSVLLPDVSDEWDMEDAVNRVEITYTKDGTTLTSSAQNDDTDSILSTAAKGRIILKRDKSDLEEPTQEELDAEALKKLKDLGSITRTVSFSHGYTPTRLGDCVELDYTRHGFGVVGKVAKQEFGCDTGMTIEEEITTTEVLFR